MTYIDLIGFTGVAILLIAYYMNLKKYIGNESLTYLVLNFAGAGIACLASVLLQYWPFIILEGCWALVSLAGIFKSLSRKDPV